MSDENKGAAKKVARRQVARVQDYQQTFSSPHGKRVLYDLMGVCHMLQPLNVSNPQVMAFEEGQRQVVLRILTYLKVDMEKLHERIREADAQLVE